MYDEDFDPAPTYLYTFQINYGSYKTICSVKAENREYAEQKAHAAYGLDHSVQILLIRIREV